MFVYSLDGLQIDSDLAADVEIEDNAITARSGVYQQLGRLFAPPGAETHAVAQAGGWPGRLREAAALLGFGFDFGSASLAGSVSPGALQAEYLRLFGAGEAAASPAPIRGGAYLGGDPRRHTEDVARSFEYFGLKLAKTDTRPPDHLATELEFMQYLAFKEAAAPSRRLGGSFHRAQEDFLERQLGSWLDEFAQRVETANALPLYVWASRTTAAFVKADLAYLKA
jgi:DMSO reductase family type II enzyme chaperone